MTSLDGRVAPTEITRRREVGTASARSLLLTVLGEFVLPQDAPVWTSTLVRLLGELGVEEKAARQALMRLAGDGWIVADRHGRRARWSLTPAGERLLADGTRRIYSFAASVRQWDGTWLLLSVDVPEGGRALRQKLRTRLAWAGFGQLPGGLWISPRPEREEEAARALADLGLGDAALSFRARSGAVGAPDAMVRQAWDLEELAHDYDEFLRAVTSLEPDGPGQTLAYQVRLVQEWRRFPLRDPGLPRQFLPVEWSGEVAADLFHRRHAAWAGLAWTGWRALAAE